jgi:hypothetical protein
VDLAEIPLKFSPGVAGPYYALAMAKASEVAFIGRSQDLAWHKNLNAGSKAILALSESIIAGFGLNSDFDSWHEQD